MRKWLAVGFLVLLLLAAGVAVALVNLNSYLNRNKAWLAERAEDALARRVSFEAVGVSLRGGLGARVTALRIGDDPAFSPEDFVQAKTVYVLVKVLPALFGRYEVRRVAVGSPSINVIRTRHGFNFASIGKRAPSARAPEFDVRPAAHTGAEASDATAPPLFIAALQLADAEIHYVDRTATPPSGLVIRELNVTAADVSPTALMRVNASAGVLQLRSSTGTAGMQGDAVRDLVVNATAQLANGRPTATGTLTAAAGRVRGIEYQDLRAEFRLDNRIASLRSLELRALNGTLSARAELDMGTPDALRFDAHANARDLALAPLLSTQFPAATPRLDGRLQGELTLTGSGSGWAAVQETLHGEGRLEIRDGALKDVNLAENVLAGITGIGGLSQLISPRVRTKHAELFATRDTRFEQLGGSVRVADGRATTDDLTVSARDYAVRGAGSLRFDKNVDFTATLIASERLTRDVLDDVKEARYLTGASGRLEIPFRLSGTLPKVTARPDAEFVAKAVQRALVEKGLGALLKGKGAGEKTPGAPGAAEELIRKGLKGLLKR